MISFLISFTQYRLFAYAWIGLALLVFFLLLFVTAPYGRHSKTTWGPVINNKLGWIIMELPVLLVLAVFIFNFKQSLGYPVWIMIGIFSFHYINRIFIFPLRLKTKGKKMPVVIVLSAIFFNLVNGSLIGYYFTHFANYPDWWLQDFRFIFGAAIFMIGLFINWKSDNMLIQLRRPNETHYVIPRGWLFDYISCPNLFGELIEWLGFAILCWNLPALCFFVWTFANLVPRAISHHKWYKDKFNDYPVGRKAVVPFVV